jgi:uncharacterized protein YdhG (YjbR/CyaY superfamily)
MSVIDDFFTSNATVSQRTELERIRKLAKELAPEVEEVISYGIPTLKYKGRNLIHFASFKDHLSLFPGAGPIAELKDKLGNYKVAKGTIQFTEANPLPDSLLKEIITSRLTAINNKSK